VFALNRPEHAVTVIVFAYWTGEKRASAEPRDSDRSIRRAAAIDDEKAIRLHLAVRPRKFLDAKHLVENDNGAVPIASRLPLSPADAVEAAARETPIAPVVPKTVKAFGGVRIDNYDWLRDRKDPRVVSYLNAENAYADARLEPIRPLVDELAAELKAREAQEDSTVPTAYNGYIYERRFSQGAQYPYVVRRKDEHGAQEGNRTECRRVGCWSSAISARIMDRQP
jgi:Prolyl oligopeptidase, N-terminal beta-propeller domain